MKLVEKYLVNEIDFIDTTEAKKNVDNVLKVISTMEDWLNMQRALVIKGKRDDAMRVSAALKKKAVVLDSLTKKIPSRKITKKVSRRSQFI